MKKVVPILIIVLLIFTTIIGCGGSNKGNNNNDNPKPRYYYKWSNGTLSASYTKTLPIFNSSIVYAENPSTTYIGSEIPPFSSLDDGNRMGGFLLIFTYYNNVLVNSTCTCNPDDGEISEYDLGNGNMVPSFVAKKEGLFSVTATYNDETLNIPVRIYHFGNLSGTDFDGDKITDVQDLTAIYGYQATSESLSLVYSPPTGDYTPNTALPESDSIYDKIYIIKTSSDKYCKVWPTGGCSSVNGRITDYNCIYYLSNENGNFDY